GVRRVLVTGMSGTGKSSALVELRRCGFAGYPSGAMTTAIVRREARLEELLARDRDVPLFVSRTVSNQDVSIRASTRSSGSKARRRTTTARTRTSVRLS